jgi:nucleoside-diphosphate-sugar epimerase
MLLLPGTQEGWNTLRETTDAELFGRATLWALYEDKASNEIFNVSNGDVHRWRQLRNELAAFYDLPIAEPLAMSSGSEMSTGCSTSVKRQSRAQSRFVRQALRIASTRTRALGVRSLDFATFASSPNGRVYVYEA